MDRVQEIARSIATLEPAEKQRLFDLLAAQGDLLARLPGSARDQVPLDASLFASRPTRTPDYVLTFDGGSRGNPGWGYGSYAIQRVQDNAQRLERLELGDGYTNNEAEYDTLFAALQDLIARIEGAGRQPCEIVLEVRGDSALVIHQLTGKWQAREPRMKERRGRCLRMLRRFGAVDLRLQPRAESVRVLGH
jgi:ribonuclease HI